MSGLGNTAANPSSRAGIVIYGFGDNSSGALGFPCASDENNGNLVDELTPVPIPHGKRPKRIVCGVFNTMLLTEDDSCLYSCGRIGEGRAALPKELSESNPTLKVLTRTARNVQLGTEESIVQVACGPDAGFFSTSKGRVHFWGNDERGISGLGTLSGLRGDQKGKGKGKHIVYEPQHVPGLDQLNVVQASCGRLVACFFTREGDVYSCGRANLCGHGTDEQVKAVFPDACAEHSKGALCLVKPQKIAALEGMQCCALAQGAIDSAVITKSGALFTWGIAARGACGLGREFAPPNSRVTTPRRVIFDRPNVRIEQVSCGTSHTMLLARDGKVFGFGDNMHHQLGVKLEHNAEYANSPVEITCIPDPVAFLSAEQTASAVITTTGRVFMCGTGHFTRAIRKEDEGKEEGALRTFQELTGFDGVPLSVHCGYNHAFLVVHARPSAAKLASESAPSQHVVGGNLHNAMQLHAQHPMVSSAIANRALSVNLAVNRLETKMQQRMDRLERLLASKKDK